MNSIVKSLLNTNVIQGVLRAILATVGGSLVASGHASPEQLTQISDVLTDAKTQGALLIGITIAWSFIHKQPAAPASPAAPAAPVK
tara:strand:+ start:2308 stop:2565 length:258 start_codon:yes stop_codon:yes gene_type:complete